MAACILLPPILYILTAYLSERHFQAVYTDEIEAVYLGDTRQLLDGSKRLRESVAANIDRYLNTRRLIPLGMDVIVTATTRSGELLYPAVFDQDDIKRPETAPTVVAQENYALMNEGLSIQVVTKFEHNRILSNAFLAAYVVLAILFFYLHFRRAATHIDVEESRRRKEIDRLLHLEEQNTLKLENLLSERERLKSEFEGLKQNLDTEKTRALQNEDELIDEIDALEKKLNENLLLQDAQQEEILELQERLVAHEKSQRKGKKQKIKAEDSIRKRFQTLYKNLTVHARATSGYVALNDELKLKAEEIIHQLNEDSSLVPIKRKVFGGKGQKTVLEVIFGYKGRLYFRNTEERRVEVLAIGTKNTQAKELEFLSKL